MKKAKSEKDVSLTSKGICKDLEDTVRTTEVKELTYATT